MTGTISRVRITSRRKNMAYFNFSKIENWKRVLFSVYVMIAKSIGGKTHAPKFMKQYEYCYVSINEVCEASHMIEQMILNI